MASGINRARRKRVDLEKDTMFLQLIIRSYVSCHSGEYVGVSGSLLLCGMYQMHTWLLFSKVTHCRTVGTSVPLARSFRFAAAGEQLLCNSVQITQDKSETRPLCAGAVVGPRSSCRGPACTVSPLILSTPLNHSSLQVSHFTPPRV